MSAAQQTKQSKHKLGCPKHKLIVVSSEVNSSAIQTCNSHESQKICCNQPYRYYKHCKQYLNLTPPPCLLQSAIYYPLYNTLYNAILNNNLDILLDNLIRNQTPVQGPIVYNQFIAALQAAFPLVVFGTESPRIMVIESDGLVIVDSSRPFSPVPSGNANSYDTWQNTTQAAPVGTVAYAGGNGINVNHNTRVVVMSAQTNDGGVAYSTKWSNSVATLQSYVAVRAGPQFNNSGTFRYSQNN
jgi:hypothetical protein